MIVRGIYKASGWHNNILLASAAGWHDSGAFWWSWLTASRKVAFLLHLCFLQIKFVFNYTSSQPWPCPGVACGMRTSTSVLEGTALQLKGALLLMTDGNMTSTFCWSINCNIGVVKWELSRKEKLNSLTHPHFNSEKSGWDELMGLFLERGR